MRFSGQAVVAMIGIALLAVGVLVFVRTDEPAPRRSNAAVGEVGAVAPAQRRDPAVSVESAEPAPSAMRTIRVENGTLSLLLRDQPLGPVLAEISRKSRVSIYSLPAVDGRSVTLELRDVPLDRGLQTLLTDCDVFFYRSGGFLRSVWVYERGAGAQLVPVPPESWASTADVERQMNSGSPAERIAAIETLVARNGPASGELVNRTLLDENAEVRLRALDVALSAGVNVSRETLTSLTYDTAPAVRALALEAIASGTAPGSAREAETEQLVRRMLGDPDPEVRARASEILDSRRTTH